jgi:16S rRNA (cytosine967-C5)-methyltransferase
MSLPCTLKAKRPMQPSAHIQAVIDLLEVFEIKTHVPADVQLRDYFSYRRYIGSKDKKAIAHMYYGIIRHIGLYDWLLTNLKPSGGMNRARAMILLHLLNQNTTPDTIEELFSGNQYAPNRLTRGELSLIKINYQSIVKDCPISLRFGLRDDIYNLLTQDYGSYVHEIIQSLNQEASFDFRVNPLKITRKDAYIKLKEHGITAEMMPYSPFGLRLEGRISREILEKIGPGMIEVQDEASQLAACLSLAKPGQRILDLCAGAGGKTLLMAANMGNKGQIVACDVSASRLKNAEARLKRAGIFNTTTRVISDHKDRWLQRQHEAFDCVFVDAPCSGSGTWRRNPDLKWKTTLKDIQETVSLQQTILQRAAQTVRPGGRLIYATCSLFSMENEAQVDWFLKQNLAFDQIPVSRAWEEFFGGTYPFADQLHFKVNPYHHKMDGFFVAIMQHR